MKKKICMLLAIVTAVSVAGCSNPFGDMIGNADSSKEASKKVGVQTGDNQTAVEKALEDAKKNQAEGKAEGKADEGAASGEVTSAGEGASDNAETSNGEAADSANNSAAENPTAPGSEDRAKDFLGLNGPEVFPVYTVESDYFYETIDDGTYTQIYDGCRESVLLSEGSAEKYPLLYKALIDQAKTEAEEFKKNADSMIEESKEMYGEGLFSEPSKNTHEVRIQRADNKVLSYCKDKYFYGGGAHGDFFIDPKTFDVNTGKELALSDVITVNDDVMKSMIAKKIYEEYPNYQEQYMKDTYGSIEENLKNYDISLLDSYYDEKTEFSCSPFAWYLTNEGLNFYFDAYAFGSHADGDTNICFRYDEISDIINKKYAVNSNEGYIEDIGMPYEKKMDIDGDGETDVVSINYIYEDGDYDYATGIHLKIDNYDMDCKPDYFYSYDGIKIYHVRTDDNHNYIYVMSGGLDDEYVWSVIDVNSAIPFYVGDSYFSQVYETREGSTLSAGLALTDPDNMVFNEHCDALGTFSAQTSWYVGDDGKPVPHDTRRKINYYGDGITVVGAFAVDIINYDGTIVSTGSFLPDRAKIYPIFTDLETYVDCEVDDGRYIRIYYTSMKYPATIEDTPVDDLFEGLMYAG